MKGKRKGERRLQLTIPVITQAGIASTKKVYQDNVQGYGKDDVVALG